jgi:hypothetical protein
VQGSCEGQRRQHLAVPRREQLAYPSKDFLAQPKSDQKSIKEKFADSSKTRKLKTI